ncbi:Putative DNA ligase-like protein/MT0965 [Variovorax sp. PBS-H4]|nr:Putative DNA ligase-like protein/MT0965 [Variovorax sp. PBS-H4]
MAMVRLDDYKPMLLSERTLGLHEPGWIYEYKYHGLRMTAAFGDGLAQLRTRNGANATKWFPELGDSLSAVRGGPYITDGEVCVLDDQGRSDFQALQERSRHRCWYLNAKPVVYCVFDLLVDQEVDITTQPLMLRKAALGRLFRELPWGILLVRYSDKGGAHLVKQPADLPGPEAFIAKRRSSIYLPGVRTSEWVKIKRKPRKQAGRASCPAAGPSWPIRLS